MERGEDFDAGRCDMSEADAARGILHVRLPAETGPAQEAPRQTSPGTPLPPGTSPLGLDGRRDGLVHLVPGGDPGAPAPLLVMLHGAGGTARHALDLVERHLPPGLVLLAPESRRSTWDIIHGGYGPDVAFIGRALEHLAARHRLDPARLAIGGFSDGASYALCLGLINGELFRHVLAFSPGFAAPTRAQGRPRIYVSHGTADDVLPIEACSRKLVARLRRAGYEVRYREFAGGHVVPGGMVDEALGLFLAG